MEISIAYIPGDGIGLQIMEQAIRVMTFVCEKFGHSIQFKECIAGSKAVNMKKLPFDEEAKEVCRNADAILLGNMWMHLNPELEKEKRPSALLGQIRKEFNLSINVRPTFTYPSLYDLSPLKELYLKEGFDILLIRDLSGGELTGKRYRDREYAYDMDMYTKKQIQELACFGFEASLTRKKALVSLDKAVVLESSRFFREIVNGVHTKYSEVNLKHQHIDDAASQIVKEPGAYDVIITNGMFGDILADEIAGLSGIQKLLPSAEMNTQGFGLYTPNNLHNTDDFANPIGLIQACALCLRYSLKLHKEAAFVEESIKKVLEEGYATKDFCEQNRKCVSCEKITDLIIEEMKG